MKTIKRQSSAESNRELSQVAGNKGKEKNMGPVVKDKYLE